MYRSDRAIPQRESAQNHSPCRKRMGVLCFLGEISPEVTNKQEYVRKAGETWKGNHGMIMATSFTA
jgi:hypothetical protein